MDESYSDELVLKRTVSGITVLKFIIDALILAAAISAYWIYRAASKPYYMGFFCDDESIKYPIMPETISFASIMFACIAVPVLTVIAMEILIKLRFMGRYYSILSLVKFVGFFLFGFFASLIVCEIGRKEVGVLRPSFWKICMPTYDMADCTAGKYISDYDCVSNSTAGELEEARTDGASSHATMIAYAVIWMCVFVHYRIKNFRRSLMMRVAIQIMFVTIGYWAIMTRLAENQNSWSGLFAGGLIGTVGALWVLLCSAEDLDYSFEGQFIDGPLDASAQMAPPQQMPTKDIYYGSNPDAVTSSSNMQRITVAGGKGFTSAYINEKDTAPTASASTDVGRSRFLYESS